MVAKVLTIILQNESKIERKSAICITSLISALTNSGCFYCWLIFSVDERSIQYNMWYPKYVHRRLCSYKNHQLELTVSVAS